MWKEKNAASGETWSLLMCACGSDVQPRVQQMIYEIGSSVYEFIIFETWRNPDTRTRVQMIYSDGAQIRGDSSDAQDSSGVAGKFVMQRKTTAEPKAGGFVRA